MRRASSPGSVATPAPSGHRRISEEDVAIATLADSRSPARVPMPQLKPSWLRAASGTDVDLRL